VEHLVAGLDPIGGEVDCDDAVGIDRLGEV
jgi:hypothetical protein